MQKDHILEIVIKLSVEQHYIQLRHFKAAIKHTLINCSYNKSIFDL